MFKNFSGVIHRLRMGTKDMLQSELEPKGRWIPVTLEGVRDGSFLEHLNKRVDPSSPTTPVGPPPELERGSCSQSPVLSRSVYPPQIERAYIIRGCYSDAISKALSNV